MKQKVGRLRIVLISLLALIVCAVCCMFSLVACDNGNDSRTIAVTSVALNKTELTLEIGGEETLTATVTPDNATNKAVTWASDNLDVADVENGKVTAKTAGTAAITAKSGDKSAVCTVTVSAAITNAMTQTEFESALALATKPLPPVNMVITSEAKSMWYDDTTGSWGTEVSEETYVDKADNGKYEMSYSDSDDTQNVYALITEFDGIYEYTGYDWYEPYEDSESHTGGYWDAALEEWVSSGECTVKTPHWHKYTYSVPVDAFVYLSDNYAQFINYFTWDNFEYNADEGCYENKTEIETVREDENNAVISKVKLYFSDKKLISATFVLLSEDNYKAEMAVTFEYGTATVTLPESAIDYPAYEEQ